MSETEVDGSSGQLSLCFRQSLLLICFATSALSGATIVAYGRFTNCLGNTCVYQALNFSDPGHEAKLSAMFEG